MASSSVPSPPSPAATRRPNDRTLTHVDEDEEEDYLGEPSSGAEPDRIPSRLRSRGTLRAICERYSIPEGAFTPVLAGVHRRSPAPGAIRVYVDALEAGMRLPLHPFFGKVLTHFGIAPCQLLPNGWRVLSGFVVLSHHAGAPPSLAVLLHFFALCSAPFRPCYSFRSKDNSGLLFARMRSCSRTVRGWREEYFYVTSSAPWPCPVTVRMGEPRKSSSSFEPYLTSAEKDMAAALLRARGDSPIDLRAYLHEGNLVAAKIVRPPSSPPPPPPSLTPQVMDASANAMAKKNLSAQNAAAEKATVKSETPSIGEKRKLAEDDACDWSSGCSGQSAPACHGGGGGGGSAALGDHPVPRGFFPKNPPPTGSEDGKAWCACAAPDGAAAAEGEWKVERQLLQGIVTPSRESELAAANPADVIASTYMSLLQTANHVAFSLRYALELDDKLRARERDAGAEADALREELWSVKAELAETKAAAADGRSDRARALAENAREAYERGREDMRRAVLRRHPHLDLARIVAPPCDDAGAGAGSA